MPDPKAALLLPLHSAPLQQLVLLETVPVTHLIATVLTPSLSSSLSLLLSASYMLMLCRLCLLFLFSLGSELCLVALSMYIRRPSTWLLRMPMSVFSCLELFWAPALNYLPAYQCHQRPALGQFHMQPADESDTTSHIVTQGQNLGVIFHTPSLSLTSHLISYKSCRLCLETPLYSLPPSLLPLSLPNSDQIHHCFPGHLKQPLNSSSCPQSLSVPLHHHLPPYGTIIF